MAAQTRPLRPTLTAGQVEGPAALEGKEGGLFSRERAEKYTTALIFYRCRRGAARSVKMALFFEFFYRCGHAPPQISTQPHAQVLPPCGREGKASAEPVRTPSSSKKGVNFDDDIDRHSCFGGGGCLLLVVVFATMGKRKRYIFFFDG